MVTSRIIYKSLTIASTRTVKSYAASLCSLLQLVTRNVMSDRQTTKLKLLGSKKKRITPGCHEKRQRLSKEEFGEKYFGDDRKLMEIAVEFREHLENTFNVDLSGLHPEDCLADVLGGETESKEGSSEDDALGTVIRKALKNYINYYAFEKYLKKSTWDIETIRFRSFNGVVREIARYRKK